MVAGRPTTTSARVEKQLSGDVVLGNLEGTLTSAGRRSAARSSPTASRSNAALVRRLLAAAGFTVMNLANNHAWTTARPGRHDSRRVRKARMLTTGGLARSPTRRSAERVASRLRAVPVGQSLLDLPAAEALVQRPTVRADLVVVTIHAGAEGIRPRHVRPGTRVPRREPRRLGAFARSVVRAGADLVVGTGLTSCAGWSGTAAG